MHEEGKLRWHVICGLFPRVLIVLGFVAACNIAGSLIERLGGGVYEPYHYLWSAAGIITGGFGIFIYGIWHNESVDSGEGYE